MPPTLERFRPSLGDFGLFWAVGGRAHTQLAQTLGGRFRCRCAVRQRDCVRRRAAGISDACIHLRHLGHRNWRRNIRRKWHTADPQQRSRPLAPATHGAGWAPLRREQQLPRARQSPPILSDVGKRQAGGARAARSPKAGSLLLESLVGVEPLANSRTTVVKIVTAKLGASSSVCDHIDRRIYCAAAMTTMTTVATLQSEATAQTPPTKPGPGTLAWGHVEDCPQDHDGRCQLQDLLRRP